MVVVRTAEAFHILYCVRDTVKRLHIRDLVRMYTHEGEIANSYPNVYYQFNRVK